MLLEIKELRTTDPNNNLSETITFPSRMLNPITNNIINIQGITINTAMFMIVWVIL